MAVAIDSSILVRYFTKDNEELFEKASMMITEAKPTSILLDRVIFAELGYVLRSVYELSKKQVVLIYESLLSNNIFSIPDRELLETTVELFNTEKPLSFEDCWLLALRNSDKVSDILTFDDGILNRLKNNAN